MTVQERKERNIKRRRRQAAKRNMFILLFTLLMIVIGSIVFGSTFSDAKNDMESEKMYMSIEIEKGDSLWEIAQEYREPGCSTKEYVDELIALNNLSSDNIQEGQHLIVSYYK